MLAGLTADRPFHPAPGGGLDRVRQVLALVQPVQDVVGKVAAVAAVEEDPHRLKRLAGGVGDRGHRDRPGGLGVLAHRAPEAPRLVLGDGYRCDGLWGGAHLGLLSRDRGDTRMNALFEAKAKRRLASGSILLLN